MSWRLAQSLVVLRQQVDEKYPGRAKGSDGTIGDVVHASGASDHNPNSAGVVCALDLTNDPATFDVHAMANIMLANPHPDLKYIISNRRIGGAFNGFKWQTYNGSDPHINHIHVSVGAGYDGQSVPPYDDTKLWKIGGSMDPAVQKDLENWKVWGVNVQAAMGDAAVPVDIINNPSMLAAYLKDLIAWKKQGIDLAEENKQLKAQSTVLKPGKYIVQ